MLRYTAQGRINRSIGLHKRLNWEFYFLIAGQGRPVLPEQGDLKFSEMRAWIFPPQVEYGWDFGPEGAERCVFHFTNVPDMVRIAVFEKGYLSMKLTESHIEKINVISSELHREIANPTKLTEIVSERCMLDLSILFLKNESADEELNLEDLNVKRIKSAIEWYRQNMSKRPTVEQVAELMNISSGHMCRLFKDIFHQSPSAYFKELRLVQTKKLLASTSLTLDQISSECGFINSSDLCRVFKRAEKVSPHIWRKNVINPENCSQEVLSEDHSVRIQNLYSVLS